MKSRKDGNAHITRAVVLFICAVFLVTCSLSAQTTQGNAAVNGLVRDASGSVIQDATVVLTETARHLDRQTTTNSAGAYQFPSITPGVYSLQVTKSGFQVYQLNDIRFEVGQLATLDVDLKVGSESQVVTVSADQQVILEHDSNALGTVVDSAQVDNLPLNGRNFLDLVRLSGGSAELGYGGVPGGGLTDQVGHPSRAVAVAGNMPYMTGYLIDGIATRGGRLGESAVNLSVAAIDQFKVQQSFFMPDQGPNSALVSVTTKGGTNAFHGQVFEFLRNRVLDAKNYFSTIKDDLKRNQFGAAVGGPVLRDRMWFYGFYEGVRQVQTNTSNVVAPTAAMFSGDFSGIAATIYDPSTYSTTTGQRTAFPGNKIPSSRINPVSAKFLQYYLPGNGPVTSPNLTVHPRSTLNDDQFGVRIDLGLTKRQTVYAQYIHQNSPSVSGGVMPLQGSLYQEQADLFVLDHTFTISPRLVNTFRLGVLRNLVDVSNVAVNGGDILSGIGITNTNDTRGLTSISMDGYANMGSGAGDVGNIDNLYQVQDGVYYAHGSHTFQFGGSLRYYRTVQQNANAQALGIIKFQRFFTAKLTSTKAPAANTGDAFADFLLGDPVTGTVAGLPKIPYRYMQFMPYFSDLWKATPNLTFNYGISWFLATVPKPYGAQKDWTHGFDWNTGLLTYAALGQVDPKIVNFDGRSIAPRFGVAWSPNFIPNTVLRAGAGIYYTDISLPSLQYAISAPPYGGSNTFTQNQTNPVPQNQFGVNTFSVLPFPAFDANYAANLPAGTAPHVLDPNSRNPTVKQWNASIQHSIGNHDVVELDYLGSAGQHLELFYDADTCIPTADLFCDYATRPYPKYASLDTAAFSGISAYEGLIAKYQHRTGGLDFHTEYTYGKSLGNGMASFHDTTKIQNARCLRCNYSRTSFDMRHVLSVSTVYRLPFGRGQRFGRNMARPLDLVVGGWTVTGIGFFSTGVPVTMSSTNTTNTIGTATNLPNRLCDGNDHDLLANLRTNGFKAFRTECFAVPATKYYGNSRQNVITGPGNDNIDLGVSKAFPIVPERVRLEFRAEMFNAFNHAQFSNPGGAVQNAATFGKVSSARAPRIGQLSLKAVF